MNGEPSEARLVGRVGGQLFPQTDAPTRWALGGVFVAIAGLFIVLAVALGFVQALVLVGSLFALATAPGAALVRLLFPRPTLLYYLLFGTVIGLAVWAVGGLLSSVTGIYLVRWLPTVTALALWFWPQRPGRASAQQPGAGALLPMSGLVGSTLATIALLPSLATTLATQPVHWEGWRQFYVDLPFQIALTGEVAARVPTSYPWVPDEVLSYTWLYHSAMGLWSSISSVPAAEIVLRAWPILFVAVMPLLLSAVAWEVTRNRLVSAVAPLIYVLAHGLAVLSGSALEQVPLLAISPTRDFAHLFTLLAVLSMVQLFLRRSVNVGHSRWWLVLLVLSSFVSVGAKGSELPLLLGGILSAGLVLILTRRVKISDFVALAWFLVAVVGSTLLVLPEPGVAALSWGPLTFLPPETPARALTSLLVLALFAATVVGFLVVVGRQDTGGWTAAAVLAGVSAAGVAGLGLFTHPGGSQLYFWQGAQPVLAIAMAWALATLWRRHGLSLVAMVAVVFLLTQVAWGITNHVWVVTAVLVGGAIVAAVVLHRLQVGAGNARPQWHGWASVIVLAAVVMSTAQAVSVPSGRVGGEVSESTTPRAIHDTQLGAFLFIRDNSEPDEIVVTNKHCFAGSLATDDCVPRWFAVAAWSERRVLVEGWAYTHLDASPDSVGEQLKLSSDFVNSPTEAERETLVERGVTLAYVDKREPYSTELGDVGKLVYESEWANVYSLTGEH